jgi:hypothetical protein
MEVQMSLTRKRKKELQRLRSSAQDLWGQQQLLLDQANAVAREASRQAGHLTREHVAPAVRDSFSSYVRPGFDASQRMAGSARDRFVGDVIPAVGTAIGTAMTVVDHARDARARTVVQQNVPKKLAKRLAPEKSSAGLGTYVAVVLGVVAAVGVLYAVWQTFRADDELWVADETPPAVPEGE